MKKLLCLYFLSFVFVVSVSAYDIEKFVYKRIESKGIRKMTTTTYDKWKTISYFDTNGFLLREEHFYKKELRSCYLYDYETTDSTLTITERRKEGESLIVKAIYKFYYSPLGACYKHQVFDGKTDKALSFADSFVYEDGLLRSYKVANSIQRDNGIYAMVEYQYNHAQQKTMKTKYSDTTDNTFYYYNSKGLLIDEIRKDNGAVVLSDVIPYSKNELNKLYIHYAKYDKQGNWTKSYFITQKGRAFRSKRTIQYW